ncbi:MAG: PQQ-binding-like beta-propeller repeat protein [Armatimonadetes bacterium]|nr:PQQ-binding-like beta-propeller repeat protein [Armatimonadota bacterium]
MNLRRAILAAAILSLISTTGSFANALMGRYSPDQRSYTAEKLQLPVALSWECVGSKFANNNTSPVVAGDRCFITCGTLVYAVNMKTGEMLWKYPSNGNLSSTVRSTAATSNGMLYFGCGDGMLYCLDGETGKFEWAFQTRGALRCPPVIYDGVIYIGSDDNSLYAVNAVTGEAVWSKPFTAKDDITGGIALGSGMIIVSCMDGNLYGINAGSGKLRWGPLRMAMAPIRTSPIISENTAIIALGDVVYGLNVRSGQVKWSINLSSESAATPACDGSTLYVSCRDKKVYAYNIAGRHPSTKWIAPADFGAISLSSPVVADDTVFITGSKGVVAAFDVADGSLKWRYMIAPAAGSGLAYTDAASSPTISDGTLTILTDDGVLHCFASNAPDAETPLTYNRKPVTGSSIPAAPPFRFSSVVYDIGSGVDFSSLSLSLDGQAIDHTVDFSNSTISALYGAGDESKTVKKLTDGIHKVMLTGKDYAGNTLEDEWYFNADSSLVPPKQDTGKMTQDPTKTSDKNTIRRLPGTPNPGGASSPPLPPMSGDRGGRGSRGGDTSGRGNRGDRGGGNPGGGGGRSRGY